MVCFGPPWTNIPLNDGILMDERSWSLRNTEDPVWVLLCEGKTGSAMGRIRETG